MNRYSGFVEWATEPCPTGVGRRCRDVAPAFFVGRFFIWEIPGNVSLGSNYSKPAMRYGQRYRVRRYAAQGKTLPLQVVE